MIEQSTFIYVVYDSNHLSLQQGDKLFMCLCNSEGLWIYFKLERKTWPGVGYHTPGHIFLSGPGNYKLLSLQPISEWVTMIWRKICLCGGREFHVNVLKLAGYTE